MFGRSNIVVSINRSVFLPAVFWHQFTQYTCMAKPTVWQDGSRVIEPLASTIKITIKEQVSKIAVRILFFINGKYFQLLHVTFWEFQIKSIYKTQEN
jgi:hypothetical protein